MTITPLRSLLIPAAVALISVAASAQSFKNPNVTFGYGAGEVVKFFYTQNFDCVEQPTDDLNFNGIAAASDPAELQTPICEVGTQPSINPPGQIGDPAQTTEPLYVLVPMFSTDNDQNPNDAISCKGVVAGTTCGPALGSTLISIFGALPRRSRPSRRFIRSAPNLGRLREPAPCMLRGLIWLRFSRNWGSRVRRARTFLFRRRTTATS